VATSSERLSPLQDFQNVDARLAEDTKAARRRILLHKRCDLIGEVRRRYDLYSMARTKVTSVACKGAIRFGGGSRKQIVKIDAPRVGVAKARLRGAHPHFERAP
jgi:hypothetical protein